VETGNPCERHLTVAGIRAVVGAQKPLETAPWRINRLKAKLSRSPLKRVQSRHQLHAISEGAKNLAGQGAPMLSRRLLPVRTGQTLIQPIPGLTQRQRVSKLPVNPLARKRRADALVLAESLALGSDRRRARMMPNSSSRMSLFHRLILSRR